MSYNYQGPVSLEYYENILLAVRIIDGLFIGNAISSQDDEFLFSNKVTHIVNCAALDVPNVFTDHGILYLSFPWRDGSVILDPQNRKISRIAKFMDKAFEKGECVLLHSLHGISRCCVIACAFLMYRFDWSLEDAYNFVKINHPDMEIAPQFMIQLKNYAKSKSPNPEGKPPLSECLLLKNTFVNSLPVDPNRFNNPPPKSSHSKKVQFIPKLVVKRKTPNHNPGNPKSILRVKLNNDDLEDAKEILRQTNEEEQAPPVKKIAFAAPADNEVSSRTIKTQPTGKLNDTLSFQGNDTKQDTDSKLNNVQAIPPPEPRSPNHHRLKKSDSDPTISTESEPKRNTSTLSSLNIQGSSAQLSTSSQIQNNLVSSQVLQNFNGLDEERVVLKNNFTSTHTKVTQLPNPPKTSFSLEQSPTSLQANSLTSSSNTSSSLRRSQTFEIVTQSSVDPDKRKRRKRSSSVEKRSSTSSYSEQTPSESDEDVPVSHSLTGSTFQSSLQGSSLQSSLQSAHRKRPTLPQKSSTSTISNQLSINSNNTHRIFQSRDNVSLSIQPSNLNGTSMDSDLSGLLTNAQLESKKLIRRPRSATHRKRKPTPMHQRPQSAPNQKDRANGSMNRISSLENIYGTNPPNANGVANPPPVSSTSSLLKKKKVKSNSRSSSPQSSNSISLAPVASAQKKKKKVKKIAIANYSNIESRLYNPTLSFLQKTNQ